MGKLSWSYDSSLNCDVAYFHGLRIRAVQDDNPSNPFEEGDEYPTVVRVDYRRSVLTTYDKLSGCGISTPLDRFTAEQLVFSQKEIERIVSADRDDLHWYIRDQRFFPSSATEEEETVVPKWITDAGALESWFDNAIMQGDINHDFARLVELYKLLDIPAYTTTVRGYCQGDWAELMVVFTPEAAARYGDRADVWAKWRAEAETRQWGSAKAKTDWVYAQVSEEICKPTTELYASWAFGDVYGYVIDMRIDGPTPDDNPDEWTEGVESCWGFYGRDRRESGLEEAAIDAAEALLKHLGRLPAEEAA